MTEWIKVRLSGNPYIQITGLFLSGSSLMIGIYTARQQSLHGLSLLLLACIVLIFLFGCVLLYWTSTRILLANPSTKELQLHQAFQPERVFSINDLTSLKIQNNIIHIHLKNHSLTFDSNQETEPMVNFLKDNIPFITEPEPHPDKHLAFLSHSKQLFFVLLLLLGVLLACNHERPVIVILLLFCIIGCCFFMYLLDCLMLSSTYHAIYEDGHMVCGNLHHFSHHIGRRKIPYFTFEDENGLHEVASLLPMPVKKGKASDYLGTNYHLWYAPGRAPYVLYGEKEPEPLRGHYIHLLIVAQMLVWLAFIVLLYITTSSLFV